MMESDKSPKTLLQKCMDIFGAHVYIYSFCMIGFIGFVGWIQGKTFFDMLNIGVSLGGAGILMHLPIVITVTLALGGMRMAKRNPIVKSLPTVETLGCENEIWYDCNTYFGLEDDINPFPIFKVPDLVLTKILDYLPLFSLKNLRLVSREMKGFVETPRHLEKFRIVATEEIQEEMVNSLPNTIQWNNFYFPKNSELSEIIIQNYGSYIRHLHIDTLILYDEIKMVVHALCPLDSEYTFSNIKTLYFWHGDDLYTNFDNYEDMKNWNKIFKYLESLGIKNYYLNVNIESITFIFKFLTMCPNLTHSEIVFGWGAESGYNIFFGHLRKYLELIKYSHKKNNLIIDFHDTYYYYSQMVNENNFHNTYYNKIENNSKDFFNLLKVAIASEIGIKFSNVPCEFLHEYDVTLTNNMRNIYDKSILSVVSRYFTELKDIYIPSTARIIVHVKDLFEDVVLPIDPIYKIEARIRCVDNFLELPSSHLFDIIRTTVKELNICFECSCSDEHDHVHHVLELPTTFAHFYPNLEQLTLDSEYYKLQPPNFYNNLFFNGLENLNCLIIHNNYIIGLNDTGILGEDINNPAILQLTNLTHLELTNPTLTDLSFIHAFQFMKLQTFCFKQADYDESVTFQNGITTLGNIQGGFKDTIEHFQITLPMDSTVLEMNEFINQNFKNIRKTSFYKWTENKRYVLISGNGSERIEYL